MMTPMGKIRRLVYESGGYVNCHAHLDRAGTATIEIYEHMGDLTLPQKWDFIDELKKTLQYRNSLPSRMNAAIVHMENQGCNACRTYIDADDTIGLLAIEAGLEAQERWRRRRFELQIAASPVRGIDSVFREACALVDVIGGLPSRSRRDVHDYDTTRANMHHLFALAAQLDKPLDMQIDQANHPEEKELQILIEAARTYRNAGYKQSITAVHCISVSAWSDDAERQKCFEAMRELDINVVVCPGAAISMKQDRTIMALTHNSIAPVIELLDAGVNVAFGVDNVEDPYMPFTLGNIEAELLLLLTAIRWQRPDLQPIADIMSANGRRVLGLNLTSAAT